MVFGFERFIVMGWALSPFFAYFTPSPRHCKCFSTPNYTAANRRGSGYIRGRFTAILKKTDFCQTADGDFDVRTTADYEMLRNYIVEGNEAHDSIEPELAQFIAYGSADWIRQQQKIQIKNPAKWTGPIRRYVEGLLTVLLANMMES